MKSKITGGETEKIFTTTILNKYDVSYFRCKETGFIQTEEPFWLEEAYSSAITKLDIGLASRNEELRGKTTEILFEHFDTSKKFLDYAGGYGLFTRMMRDKGFDFYHCDPYCENIFAEYFALDNLPKDTNFELVTTFEVFEHLPNPLEEITQMLSYSKNLLFTTELVPEGITTVNDWWYFIPETGQHISLYTEEALKFIAKRFGLNFYSDGSTTHLFTKDVLKSNPFEEKVIQYPYFIASMKRKVERYMRKHIKVNVKETLLQKDWTYIKSKLS